MKRTCFAHISFDGIVSALEVALLIGALSVAPVWSLTAIARDGFAAAYRELGGLMALSAISVTLLLRALVRQAIVKATGNERLFRDRLCLFELAPVMSAVGVLCAIAAGTALCIRVGLFWGFLTLFFGCFAFFAREISPEDG